MSLVINIDKTWCFQHTYTIMAALSPLLCTLNRCGQSLTRSLLIRTSTSSFSPYSNNNNSNNNIRLFHTSITQKYSLQEDAVSEENIVKLRGLPWNTTTQEISNFLKGCNLANKDGIHFVRRQKDGRQTGVCFVELASPSDVETAKSLDREVIGTRYIEVFGADRAELTRSHTPPPRNQGGPGSFGLRNSTTGFMIYMRGLPFEANEDDVVDFLSPIVPAEVRLLVREDTNRPKGSCEVDFNSHTDAVAAMEKNKENLGRRYVEMFLHSKWE